jgi:hypothetical protein
MRKGGRRVLVSATFNARVLLREQVKRGSGSLPSAEGIGGGGGGGGGRIGVLGLARLLLGAIELGLELDDGRRTDTFDGLVLFGHHRRLCQPSQRLRTTSSFSDFLERFFILLRRRSGHLCSSFVPPAGASVAKVNYNPPS